VIGNSVGICVGYFVGAVGPEAKLYSAVGGAIWGFISGYLVSKLEPWVKTFLSSIQHNENRNDLYIKFSMGLCCFIFSLMLTLNVRMTYGAQWTANHPGGVPTAEAPKPSH
jgi:hypothetical protein